MPVDSINIQYRYAFTENGTFVDVFLLTSDDRKDYLCFGCGEIVRPVLPMPKTKRKKHFRHNSNKLCSFETYLHKMGKLLFEKKYRYCLEHKIPYTIELEAPTVCVHCQHGPCGGKTTTKKYDLIKSFTSLKVEEKIENLKPDLSLHTSNNKLIFIEIAVTHECSEDKIKSDERIIEFKIKTEEDLSVFSKTTISRFDDCVTFYNFNPEPIKKLLPHNCQKKIKYFIVYQSGKAILFDEEIYKYENKLKQKNLYIVKVRYPSPMSFVEEAERAFVKGVTIKNCFLCRYHALYDDYLSSKPNAFCKFFKSRVKSNFAAECEIYRPDTTVFRYIKPKL